MDAVSRPQRTASESLLAITLGMEAAVVFFATVAIAGLGLVPTVVAWIGGGVLIVVFVVVARFVRRPHGVWLGWLLQLVFIATGFVHPLMFAIGAGFAGLWIYCFVTGRRLDRKNGLLPAAPPAVTPKENTP